MATDLSSTAPEVCKLIDKCQPELVIQLVKDLCRKNEDFSTAVLHELHHASIRAAKPPSEDFVKLRSDESDSHPNGALKLDAATAAYIEMQESGKRKRLQEPTVDGNNGARKKAKSKHVETHAVCRNCNELYAFDNNETGDCVYHDGYLDVNDDDDCWADHDEDCHGIIDSDDLRCAYPENYIWDCCDQNGEAEGCQVGKHRGVGAQDTYARLKSLGLPN